MRWYGGSQPKKSIVLSRGFCSLILNLQSIPIIGKYIGHLRKQHIDGMNRALAVSIHLNPKQNLSLTMCLCSICADNFRSTGAYSLRRTDPHQA